MAMAASLGHEGAMRFRIALPLACLALLPGCASTIASVVTAPVRLAGKAVDLATTSQSESDEKRGRELRKREEELGKLERSYRRNAQKCRKGDVEACDKAEREYERLDQMVDVRSREY
jgi:hypothetical protein